MMSFTHSGMDTVFKILTDGHTEEIDPVKNWGKATVPMVKDWVLKLQGAFGEILMKIIFTSQHLQSEVHLDHIC